MASPTTTASRNGAAEHSGHAPYDTLGDTDFELPELDERFVRAQQPVWNLLLDHYFRMEVRGWERRPDPPCLLVGIHPGGILPIDAYAFGFAWLREFGFD